jgi:hypothetical protein
MAARYRAAAKPQILLTRADLTAFWYCFIFLMATHCFNLDKYGFRWLEFGGVMLNLFCA